MLNFHTKQLDKRTKWQTRFYIGNIVQCLCLIIHVCYNGVLRKDIFLFVLTMVVEDLRFDYSTSGSNNLFHVVADGRRDCSSHD
ncbi:hypothetical protein ACP70R_025013 [Stipagrostis hirtigluma subsp. patula]